MRAVDDSAERQLLMPGRADLAHQKEIQFRVERRRHFVTDRHTASRKRQNEGVVAAEAGEGAAKLAPGVFPVSKHSILPSATRQMAEEPSRGMVDNLIERAGLFEQVGRARHDDNLAFHLQLLAGDAVELDDGRVEAPTINSVGARTRGKASPARSGRPPRETIAKTRVSSAAARAAPAPVLAPK